MSQLKLTGTILVVEDEYGIRLFLEHLLQRDGHTVVLAENGETAIPLIDTSLDLAILDLNLGKGLSGLDVLQEIRQRAPDTEVILLTGHGTLETAVTALREGAHDYLFKPCQAKQLRASVASGLQKRFRVRQQNNLFNQLEQNLSLLTALNNDTL
ncbi:MAG: response regulator, partial [Anaerolineales bacterium]|nr:response regulator [Anaerolineales bacterium]